MPENETISISRRSRAGRARGNLFQRLLIGEKLDNWTGWFFILAVAGGFAYLITQKTTLGLGLFGMIVGLFTVMLCMLNTEAGLYITITYSFFVCHFSRYFFND